MNYSLFSYRQQGSILHSGRIGFKEIKLFYFNSTVISLFKGILLLFLKIKHFLILADLHLEAATQVGGLRVIIRVRIHPPTFTPIPLIFDSILRSLNMNCIESLKTHNRAFIPEV